MLFAGGGQPDAHAWPAPQQVRLRALPQGVVPFWQPQMLLAGSRHTTPAAQHDWPHGVDPLGQQQPPDGSAHVSPFLQQKLPQVDPPGGHPQAPVEGFRQTVLCGQQTEPQTWVLSQQDPEMHV